MAMRATAMSGDTFSEVNSNHSGSRYKHDIQLYTDNASQNASNNQIYIGFNTVTKAYIIHKYFLISFH